MKTGWILIVLLVSTGCTGAPVDEEQDGTTGVCALPGTDDAVLFLEERQNYAFHSSLEIQSVDVRAGADIRFDWSDLSRDMLGRPVDPGLEIDMMSVLVFSLTETKLIQGMNDDSLSQSDLAAVAYLPTDHLLFADYLSLLSPGGVPLDEETLLAYLEPEEYDPLDYTFVVTLAQGEVVGKNARTLHLFRPVTGEVNQTVAFSNDDARLSFEVDLTAADPVVLPAGRADIALDWGGGIPRNAMGRPFGPYQITSAMVAHFAALAPADLEERFLEMESVAAARFTADIAAGTAVRLDDLADETGAQFSGITASGTWVVALFCGTCINPAPWFLAVLETC